MERTINDIRQIQAEAGVEDEESLLNFVVSDGQTVVATRYCNLPSFPAASLYYAFGSKFECVDRATNSYFVRHEDRRGQIGIVASEPLTDRNADWIKVLYKDLAAEETPLSLSLSLLCTASQYGLSAAAVACYSHFTGAWLSFRYALLVAWDHMCGEVCATRTYLLPWPYCCVPCFCFFFFPRAGLVFHRCLRTTWW